MDVNRLINVTKRPEVYEKGDSVMWTDEYVSKQLLNIHLNPDIDAASRKPESIERTLKFIDGLCSRERADILDLGCGPGLYTEKLAEKGRRVTGVDFSENSISYARKHADEKGLDIEYVCKNYLELDYENRFDLVIIVYTDFGVLLPEERTRFLENVYRALKPGGIFVFDVINDRNLDEKFPGQRTWSFENGGFWMPEPYLELMNGVRYPEKKVFLKQHLVIDESGNVKDYRFWVHHFSPDDMKKVLSEKNFKSIEHFENILPAESIWDGENISFYKAKK